MATKCVVEKRPITFKASPPVREWLERKATEGYRSMNAQILLLIEQAMKAESGEARP